MKRVRISTTVDAARLASCRALFGDSDAKMLDEALAALVERIEGERERQAMEANPYSDDPDLSWTAPAGPDLPYDGDVPAEVRKLAARRRSGR